MAQTSVPTTPFPPQSPPPIPPSPPLPRGVFRVGRVFSTAASLLFRNFVKFVIVGLVLALPSLVTPALDPTGAGVALGLKITALVIVYFVLTAFAQAVILHGAFQAMRSRPVNLGESVSKALSRLLPTLGIVVIWLLCLVGGVVVGGLVGGAAGALAALSGSTAFNVVAVVIVMLLIFVGAFILAAMWYVAIPACVAENLGPIRSLSRSRELTKGFRWRIVGIMLLLLAITIVAGIVVGLILIPIAFLVGLLPVVGTVLTSIVGLAWSSVIWAFFYIVVAVSYHELRVAKEGVDIDQIASVFD